jgi:anti-sigma factor RsiW
MADRHVHERIERLLAERPAVAREAAALQTQRAAVRGRLRGLATALVIGQMVRRLLPRLRHQPKRSSIIDLLRRLMRVD